jgi:hypothetical protein
MHGCHFAEPPNQSPPPGSANVERVAGCMACSYIHVRFETPGLHTCSLCDIDYKIPGSAIVLYEPGNREGADLMAGCTKPRKRFGQSTTICEKVNIA